MDLVTGYQGKAHVSAAQVRMFNVGMFGNGSYVLDTGKKFEISVLSNNLIRIADGDILFQGSHITIAKDSYEELVLSNGLQNTKRHDLIVVRYEKNADTGIESASLQVLQGTSTSDTPSDPAYTVGDILAGDTVAEFPLYRIPIDGLTVGTPVKLFKVLNKLDVYNKRYLVGFAQVTLEDIENDLHNLKIGQTVYYNAVASENVLNKCWKAATRVYCVMGYSGNPLLISFRYNKSEMAIKSSYNGTWYEWNDLKPKIATGYTSLMDINTEVGTTVTIPSDGFLRILTRSSAAGGEIRLSSSSYGKGSIYMHTFSEAGVYEMSDVFVHAGQEITLIRAANLDALTVRFVSFA